MPNLDPVPQFGEEICEEQSFFKAQKEKNLNFSSFNSRQILRIFEFSIDWLKKDDFCGFYSSEELRLNLDIMEFSPEVVCWPVSKK